MPTPTLAEYAQGRWWWWRLPLLLLLAADVFGQLRDHTNPSLFAGITFGAHEFGHLFFAFGGEFLGIAGGSLMQLLVPVGAAALLYRHRDYFGITIAAVWLASSLIDLAVYIADARAFDLDLLGFGDGAGHDWAWLLGRWHLLPYDLQIAGVVRGSGTLLLLAAVGAGSWLCIKMWGAPKPAAP
jgi:hypothetical protein